MSENNSISNNKKQQVSAEPGDNKKLGRRSFLQKTALTLTGAGLINAFPFIKSTSKSLDYPFALGVASGDPLPDGVVLWTRIAPKPLAGGGLGSMRANVVWEVAEDESFNKIVKSENVEAGPNYGHSAHVEVEGLKPNSWYYYRFKYNGEISPVGRTKTAPALGTTINEFNFAFASCQNYSAGYYTAYDYLAEEDLDVVFFLGDYIYEKAQKGNIGRAHLPEKEIYSLEDYRIRYGQYKSDPSLQAAHAAFPWIVAPDDHEVKNNWGGEGPPYDDNEKFLKRRAIAFQAYYEHMPLRKASIPDNIDMQLYRGFSYGNLAEFSVLDTRQFRTDFACGGGTETECEERFDPSRTMLGERQERWLFDNLKNSSARWNILPQQVMMAQGSRKSEQGTAYSMDKWDGYAATRERLFEVLKKNNISNTVILTGDSHKHWVNDLLEDFDNPDSPIIGTELMGTSISSGGDGTDINTFGELMLKENPHIKFFNAQRGYVRCKVTPEEVRADFRILPYVQKPGAPIKTRASFLIQNGQPGAVRL